MKPLHLYLMLALSLLVACNNAKKESSEGNDYTVNAAINDSAEHPKITALKQFIDSCDSADVSSVSAVSAPLATGSSRSPCGFGSNSAFYTDFCRANHQFVRYCLRGVSEFLR